MAANCPEIVKEVHPEKVAEDLANYERVKGLFRYTVNSKDGIERTIKQDTWSRANLFERARLTDNVQMYMTVLPSANQILHGSVGGLISHMETENALRISNPPNHAWGGEALIAAHTALYKSLESVTKSLGVEPDPCLDVLKTDHRAIWGATAPAGLVLG